MCYNHLACWWKFFRKKSTIHCIIYWLHHFPGLSANQYSITVNFQVRKTRLHKYTLFLILLNYRKSLLKGIHNFVHLNLAIALSLALVTFLAGIETAVESEVSKRLLNVYPISTVPFTGYLYSCSSFIAPVLHCSIHLDVMWGNHALY